MKQPAKKAFKNLPYKIGASSMIFGHDMVKNAEKLARIVDHVEIILFHTPSLHNLPDRKEIRRLKHIGRRHAISFSIHLPASLEIGASCARQRKEAVRLASEICLLTADLNPISYIVHVPFSPPTLVPSPGLYFKSNESEVWNHWTERSLESLTFLEKDLPGSAKLLVENINYSPSFLIPFTDNGLCGLCMDIGHLILGGESVRDNLEENFSVIREIHIHGVKGWHDHLCVSELSESVLYHCFSCISRKRFDGILNVEVFSPEHLTGSVAAILKTLKTTGAMGSFDV